MAFTLYELFYQWSNVGVFDYLLPFLLIFAIIFGVLASTRILGGHRGVNLIISIVIALMSLRLEYVSLFFAEYFPRFAIGLVILMTGVILVGLFIYDKSSLKGWFIGFGITGLVIGIIAAIMSFNTFYWFDTFFWQENWGLIVGAIIVIIMIIAIFTTAKPRPAPGEVTIPLGPLRNIIGEG